METRSSKAAEMKGRMVMAAADLFHKQGLGATSPDEIVRAAGAEMRQFYHSFKNKQGIVHEVLHFYLKAIESGAVPVKYDIQSWPDLNDWFFGQLELQRSFRMTRSCPFGTIGAGVTRKDELIRQDLSLIFDLVGKKLAAFFARENAGWPASDEGSENEMADFCIAVSQGAMLIGKITRSSQPVESAFRMAIASVEGFSGKRRSIESQERSCREPLRALPDRFPAITTQSVDGVAGNGHKSGTAGRPLDGADTRLRMIEVAADLFHEQGVGATSPEQIIEVSGTGKGQFYYYFKSKEGIVHEVLDQYLKAISSNTSHINYQIETWQDLRQWFSAHIELQTPFEMTRGCPFGTIGSEITEADALIQQDLSLIFELIHHKLATFFIREKAKGLLSNDASEGEMADFCVAAIQGGMLLGKIKRNVHVAESVAHAAITHLEREILAPGRSGPVSTVYA